MEATWNSSSFRNLFGYDGVDNGNAEQVVAYKTGVTLIVGCQNYSIRDDQITSLQFNDASLPSNSFSFGDFVGAEGSFTFYDATGEYDSTPFIDATMMLSYGVQNPDLTYTYVGMGLFIVEDCVKSNHTLSISFVDYRQKFCKEYSTPFSANMTLFNLAAAVSNYCGVELGTLHADLPNADAVVENLTEITREQCNNLIMWIAQATGTFAKIGRDGKLYFKWYSSPTIPFHIESFNVEVGEKVADYEVCVTKVNWKAPDGTSYHTGSSGYSVSCTSNPFIFSDYTALLSGIAANVVGFTYRPVNFETFRGNPCLDVGDIITVVDINGDIIPVPVTSIEIEGVFEMTIASAGSSHMKGESGRQSTSSAIGEVKNYAQALANGVDAKQTEMLLELNSFINNSTGMYTTEVVNPDGSITLYKHDRVNLEESDFIGTMSSTGYAFTNTGWNGGSPTWSFGVSREGNAIFKLLSLEGLIADWIISGIIQSSDKSVVLNLDENTLKLGPHFLDVSNGTLAFTSSVIDENLDYVFKKDPLAGTTCDIQVQGTVEATDAVVWNGKCRAETRNDSGNEGIDFVF